MAETRWQKIDRLFETAVELSETERAAFLDGISESDNELRNEIDSLLEAHFADGEFLNRGAVAEVANELFHATPNPITIGTQLGQYKVIGELGKGGQGAVYKAFDTKLNRTVAIKVLPPGLLIDETASRRFEREAQLASSLDHPNISAVHDLAEVDGVSFIVMQYVEGKSIRELLNGKPLEVVSALKIAIQVCDALAVAHRKGIIHRDIKPHNIVVTDEGVPKILDFGLAKIVTSVNADATELTALGSPYGTPTYAAPEQSRGEKVDHRSDIFSTGVLLYELLTGTWAFHGKTAVDVRHAVLHDEPKPVADRRGESIPADLAAIIDRALKKNAGDRFSDIGEMRDALIGVTRDINLETTGGGDEFLEGFDNVKPHFFLSRRKKARRIAAVGIILVAALAVSAILLYRRNANIEQAAADAARVVELAKQRRYFEAYDLARQVLEYRPNDESVLSLFPIISDALSVTSNENGANIYLKRFSTDPVIKSPERTLVGTTPLHSLTIARGDYVLEIEKEGFAPFRRTISGSPEVYWDLSFNPPPIQINAKLFAVSEIPDRMVFVPGGEYQLMSWKKPTDVAAPLTDFFIDRYEVSNREYKDFVSSGGYLKREFWKFPIIRDGKPVQWEAAMNELKDRTGLPAPRNWVNQNFPEGKADHPVTDITWYEAAAYAEFRGKSLPSVYQWEKAARNGAVTQTSGEVMPWGYFHPNDNLEYRANISGHDTAAIDLYEFGMSPFGCLNMAGNAAEWCHNETNEGFLTAGGSWGDPPYNFGSISAFPALFSSNKLGFRCVKIIRADGVDRQKIDTNRSVPVYVLTTAAQFGASRAFFRYDKTPQNGKTVEFTETEVWRREKIEFSGMNDEKALAYLYLPKNAKPPYQTIEYLPAGDVYQGFSNVPQHVENFASSQIKAGRAVFAVVLKGFIERPFPADRKPAPFTSVRYRDKLVNDAIDLSRGLDYLETRDDIDKTRIAYWGYSAGAEFGVIFSALEKRLKAVVLMSVGISRGSNDRVYEANAANFASHITAPKLLIIGRYDEQYSWKNESEPLFNLLPEPKQLIRYDAGHTPPPEIAVPAISKWLDERLGPVAR